VSIIPLRLHSRLEWRWGCSNQFAGNSGRAKESRIENLSDQGAPPSANPQEKPARPIMRQEQMIDDKKSTDPGLSAAERKTLRGREAQDALADHESAREAFHQNRERLREERMVREAAESAKVAPTPELPDDTPIQNVQFSARIQNALRAADLKTVGEVREASDETLISLPDFGSGSLSNLRMKLGLPSTMGVRPTSKTRT
jgi:Bacterial RNA polymerase, alpha chain C terminal domain